MSAAGVRAPDLNLSSDIIMPWARLIGPSTDWPC